MSPALLKLFVEIVADDKGYRQRLERHYKMWKSVVDDPSQAPLPEKNAQLWNTSIASWGGKLLWTLRSVFCPRPRI
jgi:hypothetical protein